MSRSNSGAERLPGNMTLVKNERMHASRMTTTASREQTAIHQISDGPGGNAFFSYFDHEVQRPMSGIFGMIELLKDTNLTLEQSAYIELIRRNSHRLMTMITNIFDMSCIQSECMALESIDFDLRMMLKDISRHISDRAAEKFLSYQTVINPSVSSHFSGDPGRIRQVLICLLDHVIRYTSEGKVKLHVKTQPGETDRTLIAFEITVTGTNISEARKEQLLASFDLPGQMTCDALGGTGMGFSMARQLCEMMGGKMQIGERHKECACIRFTLRLGKPSSVQRLPAAAAELSNLRVLVVDDCVTQQDTLKKQLTSFGCRYESAPDGWRAIQALQKAAASKDPFQIAIVDMALPDMNGEAIGERIRRDPRIRDTRLIMITVIGKRGDARKYQNIGYQAYLVKPITSQQLADSLSLVMGRPPVEAGSGTPDIITRHTLRENVKKKIRILFVEPDDTLQAAGRMLLKNLGYHSEQVPSGKEAMAAIKTKVYDLIITETILPEMDGYELIYRIRGVKTAKTSAAVPILCLVTPGTPDGVDRSFRAGANAVLSKPFAAEALEKMIEAMVAPHPASDDQRPEKAFDENWIRELLDDNEEMIQALIQGFMEKSPLLIRKLKKETRAKNAERIRQLGNILKGTSSAIGAHALYRIAFQVEVAGQNAAYSILPALIRNLEEAFKELTGAMDALSFTIPSMKKRGENQAGETDPVNMDVVMEIFGNNHELLSRFFADFMRNSEGIMSDILTAVTERDAQQIRLNAHKLKGSLRYLAADGAIACATELEALGKNGQLEKAEAAFECLAAEYQNVRDFISRIQATEDQRKETVSIAI